MKPKPAKALDPDAAHHAGSINVAVQFNVDGTMITLEQKVKTGPGFDERAALAQHKLQVKARKLVEGKRK